MQLQSPNMTPLNLARPHIVGVLNLTPDSFSDRERLGIENNNIGPAVDAARALAQQGASVIDVGGESTRPGADRVDAAEQKDRVLQTIGGIRQLLDERGFGEVWISIDTTLAEVAAAALDQGASMINDVSGGRESESMFDLAADRGVPIILMHMLGQPATMQQSPSYDPAKGGVVGEVSAFLQTQARAAEHAGVNRSQIVLDPGIGFGKTLEDNLALLNNLPLVVGLGYPVMVGASRKGMIATLSPETQTRAGAADRLGGSVSLTTWAVRSGVHLHRVHDVLAHRQAADVSFALTERMNAQGSDAPKHA